MYSKRLRDFYLVPQIITCNFTFIFFHMSPYIPYQRILKLSMVFICQLFIRNFNKQRNCHIFVYFYLIIAKELISGHFQRYISACPKAKFCWRFGVYLIIFAYFFYANYQTNSIPIKTRLYLFTLVSKICYLN